MPLYTLILHIRTYIHIANIHTSLGVCGNGSSASGPAGFAGFLRDWKFQGGGAVLEAFYINADRSKAAREPPPPSRLPQGGSAHAAANAANVNGSAAGASVRDATPPPSPSPPRESREPQPQGGSAHAAANIYEEGGSPHVAANIYEDLATVSLVHLEGMAAPALLSGGGGASVTGGMERVGGQGGQGGGQNGWVEEGDSAGRAGAGGSRAGAGGRCRTEAGVYWVVGYASGYSSLLPF